MNLPEFWRKLTSPFCRSQSQHLQLALWKLSKRSPLCSSTANNSIIKCFVRRERGCVCFPVVATTSASNARFWNSSLETTADSTGVSEGSFTKEQKTTALIVKPLHQQAEIHSFHFSKAVIKYCADGLLLGRPSPTSSMRISREMIQGHLAPESANLNVCSSNSRNTINGSLAIWCLLDMVQEAVAWDGTLHPVLRLAWPWC